MGNQQSSERTPNYKIRKIIRREWHSDWFRCHLDDYVEYSDGSYKFMDFERLSAGGFLFRLAGGLAGASVPKRAVLEEGRYIAIDVDWTRKLSSNTNFSPEDVKEVDVSSGDLPGEGGFQDWVEFMNQARENRIAWDEWNRFDKETQRAWQLQPPKK